MGEAQDLRDDLDYVVIVDLMALAWFGVGVGGWVTSYLG